jgi:15-cis-phytoene synthase
MSDPIAIDAAYRQCESITRSRAANFYYGIRLLRHERRRAMCAVYAFARRVDDIGDGELGRDEKLRLLDAEARALSELGQALTGSPGRGDPVFVALADAHERFPLAPAALGELIKGVRMDVDGVTYERFDDLVLYCRRVAGAIGRTCLAIFGMPEQDSSRVVGGEGRADAGGRADAQGRAYAEGQAHARGRAHAEGRAYAEALADDLGVALQLTNILRDLREDAENGRVYLPAEDLRRFGLVSASDERAAPAILARQALDTRADDAAGQLHALVRFEASRAQEWFARGMELIPLLDRRSGACVLAMAGIYHRLLDRIEAHPERALRERISLPAREKAWVAARSMLGGDR